MELNNEVIKIFIEGWLVKQDRFYLVNEQVKRGDVVFDLKGNILVLKNIKSEKQFITITIPYDLQPSDCIAFAMKSYCRISQVIEKEKL
jgi:hypothetical protein